MMMLEKNENVRTWRKLQDINDWINKINHEWDRDVTAKLAKDYYPIGRRDQDDRMTCKGWKDRLAKKVEKQGRLTICLVLSSKHLTSGICTRKNKIAMLHTFHHRKEYKHRNMLKKLTKYIMQNTVYLRLMCTGMLLLPWMTSGIVNKWYEKYGSTS